MHGILVLQPEIKPVPPALKTQNLNHWTTRKVLRTTAVTAPYPQLLMLCCILTTHGCCCQVASVVSDSVRPHRRQPTRLPHPWDSPGKNTGVGCHCLLQFPSPMHESEKWKWRRSVVSDSSPPRGLQPTRLLRPWDFPGKSTGVGCHCLLQLPCTRIRL